MKRGETYSSGWLKAQDMLDQGHGEGLTMTIKGVRSHKMDDGKTQRVLSFHEDDRELGLNQTNWDSVAEITGEHDDDNWIGKKIVAYPQKLDRPFQGYTHGMRIRATGKAVAAGRTNGDFWTLEQAEQHAMQDAGISKADLHQQLKMLGLKGYSPQRDTGTVKELIESAKATQAFDALPAANEEVSL